jgi:hypothetical protein
MIFRVKDFSIKYLSGLLIGFNLRSYVEVNKGGGRGSNLDTG